MAEQLCGAGTGDETVMGMIERVARASFDFWKATQPGKEHLKFEDLVNLDHEDEFAIAHARALVAVMRDPTDQMITAGNDVIPDNASYEDNAANAYRAMIDAALADD